MAAQLLFGLSIIRLPLAWKVLVQVATGLMVMLVR